MKDYLDYWEREFNKMGRLDKRILGVPVLGTICWFGIGLIYPNIIFPINYFFDRVRGRK